MIEATALILEDQLLDHLVIPESAKKIHRERIGPELLMDTDVGIRDALTFVLAYIDRYGDPPSLAVLAEETGYSDFADPETEVDYLIEKLRERYRRRETKRVIKKLSRIGGSDPAGAIDYGFNEFARIKTTSMERGGALDTHDLGDMLVRYSERKAKGGGVTFGFEEVDAILGGLVDDMLAFVLGRPKRYKSWFLLKSAVEAFLQGVPSMFYTLELSEAKMLDRMVCMLAGVSWQRYKDHTLTEQELQMCADMRDWASSQPHRVYFKRLPTEDRTIPVMRQIAREHDVRVVYIDQYSWLESTLPESASEHRKHHHVCRQLKDMAQEWPVYIAAQFNREAASMMEMADLAKIGLTDAIGQTADLLLGLDQHGDMKNNGVLHFGTVEARDYGHAIWETKVELTMRSNFSIINRIENS